VERVRLLLSRPRAGAVFVSGCAANMGRLFPLIDTIILLSAPVETILERLAARSAGRYGRSADERSKVASLIATVEPLLRESADHEIDTRRSVSATADAILHIAEQRSLS
jgi:shikimate kinase